ncbi:c-type cytochrome [Arenibacterium sp. CAU 1754]
MKTRLTLIAGAIIAGLASTAAIGEGHADKAALAAIKARKANMQLYAFNIGLLGGMAKGEIDYDAAAASAAAGNLAALTQLDQSRYWIPGTDNAALGDATDALPAIWESGSKVGESAKALVDAAAALDAVAGDGLEALRGAIGPVGKSCGGCHETYRKPKS